MSICRLPGKPLRIVGALSAALALLLAACGGNPRTDDFVAEVDAVCIEHADRTAELSDELDIDALEFQYFRPDVIEINSDALHDLAEIDAPESLESRYSDLLTYWRRLVEIGTRAWLADDEGFTEAEHAFFDIYGTNRIIALDLGLFACANRLPPEKGADFKAAIQQLWTTANRRGCTEDFTAEFVELWAEGLRACERERRAIVPAESVEVGKARGIQGVSARALITPRGGTYDGGSFLQEFRYEDGRWKLDFSAQKV